MVDKSEKFSWLVRVGYFSRAILYTMIGFIALTAAGKVSEGSDGIFRAIEEFPGGSVLLLSAAMACAGGLALIRIALLQPAQPFLFEFADRARQAMVCAA